MFRKGFTIFGWAYFVIGLAVGQAESKVLLVRSALGLAFALTCCYLALRLVIRDPYPSLRRAEGTEPGAASGPGAGRDG
jgi:hypothetical protein